MCTQCACFPLREYCLGPHPFPQSNTAPPGTRPDSNCIVLFLSASSFCICSSLFPAADVATHSPPPLVPNLPRFALSFFSAHCFTTSHLLKGKPCAELLQVQRQGAREVPGYGRTNTAPTGTRPQATAQQRAGSMQRHSESPSGFRWVPRSVAQTNRHWVFLPTAVGSSVCCRIVCPGKHRQVSLPPLNYRANPKDLRKYLIPVTGCCCQQKKKISGVRRYARMGSAKNKNRKNKIFFAPAPPFCKNARIFCPTACPFHVLCPIFAPCFAFRE